MLTDRRTDGRTDDGRKVITIAHPEQSSGELKIDEICPLGIPKQILMSMHIANLVKNPCYLLKLSSRNENMGVSRESFAH